MKKQVLALSCALALGASAALSPATDQAAEPTAQIGYGLSQYFGANANMGKAAGASVGGFIGYQVARTQVTTTVIRGMTARSMMVVGARFGASVGLAGGIIGVAAGAAIGAL